MLIIGNRDHIIHNFNLAKNGRSTADINRKKVNTHNINVNLNNHFKHMNDQVPNIKLE